MQNEIMQHTKILSKYRSMLIKMYMAIAAAITILEIALYFGMLKGGIESRFFDYYPFAYIVLPSAINFCIIFIINRINKSNKVTQYNKNNAVIYGLECMALNVSIIHCLWSSVSCCLCIPILMSTIFGNKKLMRNTLIFGLISLVIATYAAAVIEHSNDELLLFNASVALLIIIVSFMISNILLRFEQETYLEIKSGISSQNKLKMQLQKDQMTGLFNHTAFYHKLFDAVKSAQQNHSELSLAVIDIDNFKHINDAYGHECGNIVLIRLSAIISEYCAKSDIACRYGGEEFAIIFNKSINDAQETVYNILKRFRTENFEFTDEYVTFSCGLCSYKNNITPQEFFNLADKAMYDAKHSGKNKCVAY